MLGVKMGGKNESFKQEGDSWGKVLWRDPWRSLTLLHFYFPVVSRGVRFFFSFFSLSYWLGSFASCHATISTFLKIFLPLLSRLAFSWASISSSRCRFLSCISLASLSFLLISAQQKSFIVCLYTACLNSSGSSSSTFVGFPSFFNCFSLFHGVFHVLFLPELHPGPSSFVPSPVATCSFVHGTKSLLCSVSIILIFVRMHQYG